MSKSSTLPRSLPSLAKQVRIVPKLFINGNDFQSEAKVSAVIKGIQSQIAIITMHLASDRFERSVNVAISA